MSTWLPESLSVCSRRDWLLGVGAADLRREAGISQQTVARALGVSQFAVHAWETGRSVPVSEAGSRYCRVVAGLARHASVDVREGAAEAA